MNIETLKGAIKKVEKIQEQLKQARQVHQALQDMDGPFSVSLSFINHIPVDKKIAVDIADINRRQVRQDLEDAFVAIRRIACDIKVEELDWKEE